MMKPPAIARPRPRVIVFCGRSDHQESWCGALAQGLRRHNVPVEVRATPGPHREFPDADVYAFWGHRHHRLIDWQRAHGRRYLVIERGYFGDRFAMTSLGWNGLNGNADFCNANSPPDRWEKHGVPLSDWKIGGEYALICGQVHNDAAVAGVDLPAWYANVARLIARTYPKMNVRFRPHPLARRSVAPPRTQTTTGPLAEDLRGAAFTVSYNSNTGVDSILAGVPTYRGSPGSMTGDLAPLLINPGAMNRFPSQICSDERQQWANNLAYCQWSMAEIVSGEAWAHVRRGMDAPLSEKAA